MAGSICGSVGSSSSSSCDCYRNCSMNAAWTPILVGNSPQVAASASTNGSSGNLSLDSIRDYLIHQEDSIVYKLTERAQYCLNAPTYDPTVFHIPDFQGSLIEYILIQTESLHAKVRRYLSPDENPFFPDSLPSAILPPLNYPEILYPGAQYININPVIWRTYFDDMLPGLVSPGDDGNYGSTAVSDVECLQALSKRIHYGKFVAEAKYRESPELFEAAIRAQDRETLLKMVTNADVEAQVVKRVEKKAKAYAREIEYKSSSSSSSGREYKVDPMMVASVYKEWVIPLTKAIEVDYLLRRLD